MKADLVMAIHFHQPVGNFDHVIDGICDKCYIPFIETLKEYNDVRMTFHITGCLLEWMKTHRPEIIETIKGMVSNSQVDMMSGGFYEPILPSIPYRDRVSQINLLTEYVKDKFGVEAKGAWIAERVWEPELASVLHDTGIKYVILDDTHFLYSGLKKRDTYGYYTTEDNGKTVAVFPSDKILRYHIPFRMPEECTRYMRHVASQRENPLFIYGDDAEKFGEWPGTFQWVHTEGWLRKFFDELVNNRNWLNMLTFSECMDKRKSLGNVYLPTSSYEEMLEWALPVDSQEEYEHVLKEIKDSGKHDRYMPYIRGGFWRNFLTKYPESNHMNKRVLYASNRLGELRKNNIDKDLLGSQCNCAYWHGVFGGLYLFHLRRAIYHYLIRSEKTMDKAVFGKKSFCGVNVIDWDADGLDEIVIENREVALFVDPGDGGIIREIDIKNDSHNLMNTLSRRKEVYHKKIVEKVENDINVPPEECQTIHDAIQVANNDIVDHLVYDPYERYSLIDHFFDANVDIETFSGCAFEESGDFVKNAYRFSVNKTAKSVILSMERKGTVRGLEVKIEKRITLPKKGALIGVNYVISNLASDPLDICFAPEMNFSMPNAEEVSLKLNMSEPARVWCFPINTVSQSEISYELNYQGTTILPAWELKINPGEVKTYDIEVKIV